MGGAFYGGLFFENCRFVDQFDMLATGHNMNGSTVRFSGCRFEVFADFEDCWFEGPVEFIDCDFQRGSNLLGNSREPFAVTFDVAPQFQNVHGDLTLSNRGFKRSLSPGSEVPERSYLLALKRPKNADGQLPGHPESNAK
jgi:hypothetical protein